jgi:hypothetical protein
MRIRINAVTGSWFSCTVRPLSHHHLGLWTNLSLRFPLPWVWQKVENVSRIEELVLKMLHMPVIVLILFILVRKGYQYCILHLKPMDDLQLMLINTYRKVRSIYGFNKKIHKGP